ncbi:hypothetical protein VCSRO54_1339 [Vibrio cholerae]|nr:hypothetical protein FLL67_13975 [Vibrio cholerae]TQQ71465.1 hypothetical protein FLL59_12140 [Vibrio cholerae]TXZ56334.1 hypothetical protein FXE24_07305 [Vibrio cholerae]GHW08627.1 hypothetical protein VCSRO54_1339 [Vibrio cholerae]GHY91371.1 hypothetical protein VCSRO121_1676 [Vibrio cholerae]
MGKDSGILKSNKNRKKYHNDLINLFLNRQLSILKKKKKSRGIALSYGFIIVYLAFNT